MKKAKSRLIPPQTQNEGANQKDFIGVQLKQLKKSSLFINYFSHLPTLVIALFFYGLLLVTFVSFDPDSIKNILITNAYLPVLVLFFLAHFFLLSFVFLNATRGLFYSLVLLVIFFLKTQQVAFDMKIFLGIVLIIATVEGILKLAGKLLRH